MNAHRAVSFIGQLFIPHGFLGLKVRDSGRRLCVVIVAEGAQDDSGNPVTSNQIQEVKECQLKKRRGVFNQTWTV